MALNKYQNHLSLIADLKNIVLCIVACHVISYITVERISYAIVEHVKLSPGKNIPGVYLKPKKQFLKN